MINFGFLIFLLIAGMAFWLLIFLASFIPYWAVSSLMASMKPKTADLDTDDDNDSSEPETVTNEEVSE